MTEAEKRPQREKRHIYTRKRRVVRLPKAHSALSSAEMSRLLQGWRRGR